LPLKVTAQLGPHFADGVRLMDLTPVRMADLVAAIAAGVGLRTSGGPLIADVNASPWNAVWRTVPWSAASSSQDRDLPSAV
jgi:hypothetical protein